MSANRRLSNSRLKFPVASLAKFEGRKQNYSFVATTDRKDDAALKSKIPKCTPLSIKPPLCLNTSNSSGTSLPVYHETPDIKARPFKKKTGFFVKKSDKKLTVPMNPRISAFERREEPK